MVYKVFCVLAAHFLLFPLNLSAQKSNHEWQIGYFAPYLTHTGGTIGYAFSINKEEDTVDKPLNSKHSIHVLTQLSYFTQVNTSDNIVLNPEIVYKWNNSGKRFFLSSSLGTGYLLAFQRQDGVLNLATGEMDHSSKAINYFLPNLNLGLGLDPRGHIGWYLKATYGRKVGFNNANGALFGLSAGLIIHFKATE